MVELVDTQDLKSCALNRRAGSIPALDTTPQKRGLNRVRLFLREQRTKRVSDWKETLSVLD